MSKYAHSVFLMMCLIGLISGCGKTEHAPTSVPPVKFDTLLVTNTDTNHERLWDGVVDAVNKATLSAQTAGRVIALPFDVNDEIKAGDVLVRFTDIEQRASRTQTQAAFIAAQANAHEAQLGFTRAEELRAKKLIAQSIYDQALAKRDAARASLDAARAGVKASNEQVDYTVIRSPYSGIVFARHVQIGETVQPGQALISALSPAQLRIEVELPQSEILAVREKNIATIVLENGQRIAAKKMTIFPYADAATHTFKVRLDLPEMETGLRPGMTIKVGFAAGTNAGIFIPQSSIVQRGEISLIYVVDKNNRVALRHLRLGQKNTDQIEVLAGLSAGERIAVDPLAALKHIQTATTQ